MTAPIRSSFFAGARAPSRRLPLEDGVARRAQPGREPRVRHQVPVDNHDTHSPQTLLPSGVAGVAAEGRSTSIYLRDASGAIDRVARGGPFGVRWRMHTPRAALPYVSAREGYTVEMVAPERRMSYRIATFTPPTSRRSGVLRATLDRRSRLRPGARAHLAGFGS